MNPELKIFRDPRSVAVVGASADPAKWGHWMARGALRGSARRQVHLINARGATIDGTPSVPSLSDLDVTPELVVLCTPPASTPGIVAEALDLGVSGFVGITAGIDAEHDQPGLEAELGQRIRNHGARIIGPSCLGIYDAAHQLDLVWGNFTPGQLAVVSQSGQVGLELAGLAARLGLGISRFVSIGSQVDVTAAELCDDLVHDELTQVVVLYLEHFSNGRTILEAMARLRSTGKTVVVLTVGASEASRQAAHSHTGALTASTDVVAAACRQSGAVLVRTPAEAIEAAHLLLASPLPSGRRVTVVSDSGGQGAIAADAVSRAGLTTPELSQDTSSALADLLPREAGVRNPIDLAGAGEQDLATYHRIVDRLLDSGEVDSVLLTGYFGSYGNDIPELLQRELAVIDKVAESVTRHGSPVLVHSMSDDSESVWAMRERGVPVFNTVDSVARAMGVAAQLASRQPAPLLTNPVLVSGKRRKPAEALEYLEGRRLIETYGIDYPPAHLVTSSQDVTSATDSMLPPFVLKAGWLEHKTELDGVRLGLIDATSVQDAFDDMVGRLGVGNYVLEEMDSRDHTVEMIIGARHDDSFGPLALVGAGGIHAELDRDVAIGLAPLDEAEALDMVTSLRIYPLLTGWRGKPAVDIEAVARAVSALSRLIANEPVTECEINPFNVGPNGAIAVDAMVRAELSE